MTCNNALVNDMMIDALAELLPAFPGGANRMRRFTHILNLVVKVILRQFDGAKEKANERLEGALHNIDDLVGDIEVLEGDDDELDDNEQEGSADPCDAMSEEECDDLDATVHPLRLVLTKVSSNSAGVLALTVISSYENFRSR